MAKRREAADAWRLLATGCFLLAAGLAVNSLLGPLAFGVIDYRYTETFENQAIGLDAFSLAIAGPLLLVAGALALRGYVVAPFLALGPSLMAAYMLPQYVLGGHYDTLPGNNEDFFLLHLGLFVLSVGVAVVAWTSVDAGRLPPASARSRRWTGVLMPAVAVFLALRYLPTLMDIWQGRPSEEYLEDPIAFWLIAFMDLGIVMPAALACGVALLSGAEGARKPMYAIVAWFALVGPAVAAMGFAMSANDDPNASLGSAIVFAVYGAAFASLAAFLFRPLFEGPAAIPTPAASRDVSREAPTPPGGAA
ncbi:MAG TPA: hypothetical protein VNN21_07440 [Dehalococcoidia bacterium]|nr:hypothetical protein [Dehalococcoidia bacterium]